MDQEPCGRGRRDNRTTIAPTAPRAAGDKKSQRYFVPPAAIFCPPRSDILSPPPAREALKYKGFRALEKSVSLISLISLLTHGPPRFCAGGPSAIMHTTGPNPAQSDSPFSTGTVPVKRGPQGDGHRHQLDGDPDKSEALCARSWTRHSCRS